MRHITLTFISEFDKNETLITLIGYCKEYPNLIVQGLSKEVLINKLADLLGSQIGKAKRKKLIETTNPLYWIEQETYVIQKLDKTSDQEVVLLSQSFFKKKKDNSGLTTHKWALDWVSLCPIDQPNQIVFGKTEAEVLIKLEQKMLSQLIKKNQADQNSQTETKNSLFLTQIHTYHCIPQNTSN